MTERDNANAAEKGAVEANPYAPPRAVLEAADERAFEYELAGRFARLLARIIDGFIVGIPILLSRWFFVPDSLQGFFRDHPALFSLLVNLLTALAWASIYLFINFRGLRRDGQTLGKSALGIRIVRADGFPADLLDTFVKRELPVGILGQLPILSLVALVNPFLIFSRSRRCLHDLVAGTIVVTAQSWRPAGQALPIVATVVPPRRSCPYCAERFPRGALTCPACERDVTVVLDPDLVNRHLSSAERLVKAHRLYARGDSDEALALYEWTVREDPDCLEAWLCILHTTSSSPDLKLEAQAQVERIQRDRGSPA
jgi:uncharacterized RDD family membrane protein YckC